VSGWDPEAYRRFAAERAQPFHDLLALAEVPDGGFRRAVDLGCGPGELTALAARQLGIGEILGIDHSPEMLAQAHAYETDGVSFAPGDIATWSSAGDHDLVIAAASLQWVPDHAGVLRRWAAALAPGGQLLVQVPANAHQATHRVAVAVAASPPFVGEFGADGPPADPVAAHVLEPEAYARVLHDLGFERQHVRLQVYPHVLASTSEVVEWVKGTTLTRFRRALADEVYERFVDAYAERLVAELGGQRSPFFFPFRRILMWARRPA